MLEFDNTCIDVRKQKIKNKQTCTSVIRTLALNASELRGSSKKSEFVSPVNATSGDNMISVI